MFFSCNYSVFQLDFFRPNSLEVREYSVKFKVSRKQLSQILLYTNKECFNLREQYNLIISLSIVLTTQMTSRFDLCDFYLICRTHKWVTLLDSSIKKIVWFWITLQHNLFTRNYHFSHTFSILCCIKLRF